MPDNFPDLIVQTFLGFVMILVLFYGEPQGNAAIITQGLFLTACVVGIVLLQIL